MEILPAALRDAPSVMRIIDACKRHMQAGGSDQWDDVYPDLCVVEQDARTGTLFVLRDSSEPVGAVCLNEVQPAEYALLPWRYQGRILVIHRLCVLPERQGTGASRVLMDFAEGYAARHGYDAIRLDTYIGNPRALALYDRRGYRRAGQVSFPRRRLRFECFERAIFPQELIKNHASGARDVE